MPARRRTPRRLALAATAAVAALSASIGMSGPASAATAGIVPVPSVNVQQYLGTWKQIADIPQVYEVFCVKNVTARYSLNADGTVKVHNTCAGPFGSKIVTDGAARALDAPRNASLQVSFVNLFGKQVFNGTTPNYVILGLASDYSWAVVGDPGRRSGYVLSRTVTLSPAKTAQAKAALVRSGYDPCALKTTIQDGGTTKSAPFC
jgi:apolipoprotein D and lipocalin family protein